jgi:hypothetical protein
MITNKINGIEVTPMGKQKAYLMGIYKTNNGKCQLVGSNYNGYGYKDWTRNYILTPEEVEQYNLLAPTVKKPKKSYEEREKSQFNAWCKRLAKLTGITIEEAENIAIEKLNYKQDRINAMIERDMERPSIKRNQLIRKMERENPLRKIKDVEHAKAILVAHNRHNNTNYESLLEEARELANIGEIEKDEVKEYARQKMTTI